MTLKPRTLSQTSSSGLPDISLLSQKELLRMRADIDSLLDLETLDQLDIGKEIVVQLRTLKVLQQEALEDVEAPHGQKAQAAMTVSRLLQELSKSRKELYDAERSMKIEGMVIEAMKSAPDDVKNEFFTNLERYLGTLPSMATLLEQVREDEPS